jgi:hypothetical protein
MQANNEEPERPAVIVKGWGDEPGKLLLYRIENNRCFVASAKADRPIGLPCDQVFAFNEDKFNEASTAFQQGNMRKLGEIWAKMTMDDFACDKYKNSVPCSHDQEHLANPESAPSGNVG